MKNKKAILFLIILLINLVYAVNYPAPFVEGSTSGEPISEDRRSSLDQTEANTVADDLSASLESTGDVTISGDAWKVGTESLSSKKELWSQEGLCGFIKGCAGDNVCYPFGFIKEEQYCGFDKGANLEDFRFEKISFHNQSNAKEKCIYDFECKSNFCFNNLCVGNIESLLTNILGRLGYLEDKVEKITNQIIKTGLSKTKNSNNLFGLFKNIFSK